MLLLCLGSGTDSRTVRVCNRWLLAVISMVDDFTAPILAWAPALTSLTFAAHPERFIFSLVYHSFITFLSEAGEASDSSHSTRPSADACVSAGILNLILSCQKSAARRCTALANSCVG